MWIRSPSPHTEFDPQADVLLQRAGMRADIVCLCNNYAPHEYICFVRFGSLGPLFGWVGGIFKGPLKYKCPTVKKTIRKKEMQLLNNAFMLLIHSLLYKKKQRWKFKTVSTLTHLSSVCGSGGIGSLIRRELGQSWAKTEASTLFFGRCGLSWGKMT